MIDLRTLRPLDTDTILASLAKTHRAVIVDEGWKTGRLAGEISAQIMEHGFDLLDWPVQRVCGAEVPMPYAKHLEEAALPSAERVVAAVTEWRSDGRVRDALARRRHERRHARRLAEAARRRRRARRHHRVVHTDKADVEVEVFTSGVIERMLIEPGTEVPVGTPLAVIREDGRRRPPLGVAAAAPLRPLRAAEPPAGAPAPAPAALPRHRRAF